MTVFLSVICVLVGLIALVLIIALFTKKEYSIVRETTIHKPKEEVFNYLTHLKNQDAYNKWVMADPAMKKEYKGTDATTGFVYSWDSDIKSVGKGEQEIKKITPNSRIDIEVRFIKPFAGVSQTFLSTDVASGNQTTVKWGMESAMKYPMNAMLLFMNMEKMLGNDLQESLNNLKQNMKH